MAKFNLQELKKKIKEAVAKRNITPSKSINYTPAKTTKKRGCGCGSRK